MTRNTGQSTESVFTYETGGGESLSEGVVHAVSAVSGADPVPEGSSAAEGDRTLEPLYSVVDPDALDSVFRPTGSSSDRGAERVTLRYHGYEVTVCSEGRISVETVEESPDPVSN